MPWFLERWDRSGVPVDRPRKVMVTKSLEWSLAKSSMRDKGNVLTAQPPHPTPRPKQDEAGSGQRQAALALVTQG